MSGSLKEWGGVGSGKWRLRVSAGYDGQGKRVTLSRNFVGTRRQAETALAKLIADVDGQQTKSHAGSVGELLDEWVEWIEPDRSKYTIREHRRSVDKTIKPSLGSVRVDRLTARHLDDFYRSLRGRGLSAASIRRHHSILSAALDQAVKRDWIPSNPAAKATVPGVERRSATAPDTATVQKLIYAAEQRDHVLGVAIALAAITGARRGELCALRWSDVDWERRTLRIERSLTVINREATEGPTKTHSRRDIAIDEALGALLTHRRDQQEDYAATVGVPLHRDPYMLSRSADGSKPCPPDSLTGGYRRLAQRLGGNGHFHELRHWCATAAIASGADVRTVSGRLGHADPSVTLKVYSHALEARDRELAGLLGQAVLGSVEGAIELDTTDSPAAAKLERTG
jgi:integrase